MLESFKSWALKDNEVVLDVYVTKYINQASKKTIVVYITDANVRMKLNFKNCI